MHYGVVMSNERLNYNEEHEHEYPEQWEATKQRLENTWINVTEFNERGVAGSWNQELTGFAAQQAVENGLRGILSARNCPETFRHNLNMIWDHHVQNHHKPEDSGLQTSDSKTLNNVRRCERCLRCNLREQATQEGAVSQSPQEYPTGAVHVSVHSETISVLDHGGATQVGLDGAVPTAGLAGVCLIDINHQCTPLPGLPAQTPLELVVAEAKHHPRGLAADPSSGTTCHVLSLEGREQDDLVSAGQPARSLPMQFVHQVDDSLPYTGLCLPHLAALPAARFSVGAADQVVQMVAEPLDASKGVMGDLAAVGFGKVREKGTNAGVERHYAIAAWGLNVALRWVWNDQPVQAAFLYQSAFLLPRRGGLGHPQRSYNLWVDTVLKNSVVGDVAGLTGVLAAAKVEFGELFVQSLSTPVVLSQLLVELLDVAHGPAGVAHRGTLHLVGDVSPLRMEQF